MRLSVLANQLEEFATRPVPMVIGMPLAAAEIVIRSATGVSHIDVDRDPRAHARDDTVIAQTPVPGTHVSRSDQIRLAVSTGRRYEISHSGLAREDQSPLRTASISAQAWLSTWSLGPSSLSGEPSSPTATIGGLPPASDPGGDFHAIMT